MLTRINKGAYILQEAKDQPAVILVGTGSETSLCVEAAKMLEAEGVKARVVSMPCWELFEEQQAQYKSSVFPGGIPVVSVEASSVFGWERYSHVAVGMHGFGASAPAKDLYKRFGITSSNIAETAKKTIAFFAGKPVPHLVQRIQL
jgi:transketolase